MPLLDYDEVIAISYVSDDIAVLLTPEQQSLAIQALALFNDPFLWENYEDNADAIDALVADTQLALELPQVITPLWVFRQQRLWGDQFSVQNGNPVQWVSDANQYHGGYFRQNAPAINDERYAEFTCTPGKYKVFPRSIKTSASGIMTMYIDGTSIGTKDQYSAALVYNDYVQSSQFDITTSGTHELRIKVLSKNASSSNYVSGFTYFDVVRVADL